MIILTEAWLTAVTWIGWFVFIFMLFVVSFYFFLLIVSISHIRSRYQLDDFEPYEEMLVASYTKPVSILVPAYNESAGIYGSVRSLLSLDYPEYEVIVINDGSKDSTLAVLIEKFELVKINKVIRGQIPTKQVHAVYRSKLYPNLLVVDKENGGKADALNVGINVSKYPYFCSIDGDSVLERDAFLKVMKPIIDADGDVIVSGGSVRIANGCKIKDGQVVSIGLSSNPVVIMQVIEYLRAFLMGRISLSYYNLLLIVSGAFGVFSKQWVIEAGGYAHTVGEDMELIVRLHRLIRDKKVNKQIVYVADPVCWTEAPESMKFLQKQRSRWHRGLFESLWKHRNLLFNRKYGAIGFVSIPYFLIIEFLGPVVEMLGYIIMVISPFLGGSYVELSILLFLIAMIYGSLFSMAAVLLEEWSLRRFPKITDIVLLFLFSLTETLWYRPLTVFWRCQGIVHLIRKKQGWGEMKRKGVSR